MIKMPKRVNLLDLEIMKKKKTSFMIYADFISLENIETMHMEIVISKLNYVIKFFSYSTT